SGADRATSVAPMEPLAPPLFSTITDCPRDLARLSASRRAIASVMDPAGNGTTMRISLAGHGLSCANARVEPSPNADAPATLAVAARKSLRVLNIVMLCLRKI